MGTDIYLWENHQKTDEEEQAYIRASIWMTEENGVLRIVFPEKYWDCEANEFDFTDERMRVMTHALQNYLAEDPDVRVDYVNETGVAVAKMLQLIAKESGSEFKVCSGDDLDKEVWARTVLEFFNKGRDLQEKTGKKPIVGISW